MQVYILTYEYEAYRLDENGKIECKLDKYKVNLGYFSNFEKAMDYLKDFYFIKTPSNGIPAIRKADIIKDKHISFNMNLKTPCSGCAYITIITSNNNIKYKVKIKLSVSLAKCLDGNNAYDDIFDYINS